MSRWACWCCFLVAGTLAGAASGELLTQVQSLLTFDYIYNSQETRWSGIRLGFWCGSALGLTVCLHRQIPYSLSRVAKLVSGVLGCVVFASLLMATAGYLISSTMPTLLSATLSSPRRFAVCFGLRLGAVSGMLLSVAYVVVSIRLYQKNGPCSDLGD